MCDACVVVVVVVDCESTFTYINNVYSKGSKCLAFGV